MRSLAAKFPFYDCGSPQIGTTMVCLNVGWHFPVTFGIDEFPFTLTLCNFT